MRNPRQVPWVRRLVRRVGVARLERVAALVLYPPHVVTRAFVARVQRDPALVVLGAPLDRFADNAAYLFLHLSSVRPSDLEPVWISGSADVVRRLRAAGHRAEQRWSLAGLRVCLRAGTFVYSGYRSDINSWLAPGAVAVCLWHGLPIKRIERDARPSAPGVWGRLDDLVREAPPDVLLSSTDRVSRDLMAPAFGIEPERCWSVGYPRNDHLVSSPRRPPDTTLVPDRTSWDLLAGSDLVVGLFLTWRDGLATDVASASLLRNIADLCHEHGARLAYKAHFNVSATEPEDRRVVQLEPDADLNAYLGLCDLLVTDYSSVSLDFLLMRRPVIYYAPDLEEYARTRGFAIDPTTLPGHLEQETTGLLAAVADALRALSDPEAAADPSVDGVLRDLWGDYAGHASAAIAARLTDRTGPPRGLRAR
jgi:CDP-glycerol glycerophosphotransferase (TagB/SpsB family)